MSTYDSINKKRAEKWIIMAFQYNISKLFPGRRNPNLWVFSAWEGQKYADNARYLFEYMLSNHKDISCVWQTQSEDIYNDLINCGIPVQFIGTPESRDTQKKAGVAVFTHGIDDFGYTSYIFGAKLICLWHGFGFKTGYREIYHQPNPLKRFLSNCRWDIFNWAKRDISLVVSEYTKKQYIRMFRIKDPDSVLIAGQSRYDAFANEYTKRDVFKDDRIISTLENKKLILYMPTFRIDSNAMIAQIKELVDSKRISDILEMNNAVIVSKLHYLNRGDLNSTSTFIMLNDNEIKDTQLLLSIADILITDYSSCAVDYSLFRRPELFYCPDWEVRKKDRDLIPETDEISRINRAISINELSIALAEVLSNPGKGITQCEKVREYFCNLPVEIGGYAKYNYMLIRKRLSEKYHIVLPEEKN